MKRKETAGLTYKKLGERIEWPVARLYTSYCGYSASITFDIEEIMFVNPDELRQIAAACAWAAEQLEALAQGEQEAATP